MYRTAFAFLALVAAAFTFTSCTSEEKKSEAGSATSTPLTVEDSATVVVSAKVEAINYSTRRITLRDQAGYATTFIVGPQVQRLNEVAVGDSVKVEYSVSLEAELRPPTADEAANPIVITETTGRSPESSDPSGSEHRRVRVVTTVAGVDIDRMLVTLRGPMGDTTTVRARKLENIKRLHVGDTIVITYVESSVISLVKAPR